MIAAPPRRPSATAVLAALAVAVFAVLAWHQRWTSDDGLIVVREIRQILDGEGPNYNPFQRAEVGTSALWPWIGAAAALVLPGEEAVHLMAVGLLMSVAGLGLALSGAVRFHRARGVEGLVVPAGALIVLAVAGFWDFATSGLETGLCLLWLGTLGRLFGTVSEQTPYRRRAAVAVVVGLGPLVRPDLGLVTVILGLALLLVTRPGLRRGLGLVVAIAGAPVGYEVFRAGYYGILVPLPALAKEASSSLWARGTTYLVDFAGTYLLAIPAVILAVVGARVLSRRPFDRPAAVFFAAPVLCGVLLGLYVVRVGGDYMHARMWVPAVFALLLPVMAVPVGRDRRLEAVGVALLAVWALVSGAALRTPYSGKTFGPNGITNERSYEATEFKDPHPMSFQSRHVAFKLRHDVRKLTEGDERPLILSTGPMTNGDLRVMPLSPGIPDYSAFSYSNMGIAEGVALLETTVVDVNGLASPLAGHLEVGERSRPGHEKWLPAAWVIAEYADPTAIATMSDTPDATKAQASAARHALSCGKLKELLDSVDQPMSWSRFWANLRASVARTTLRVPADPLAAERRFCG